MAGAGPDSHDSRGFSRLNQAFPTPFVGAGGSGWKLVVRASRWHPRRSVKLPEEGGRGGEKEERVSGKRREREDREERETRKCLKLTFSLPGFVQTPKLIVSVKSRENTSRIRN